MLIGMAMATTAHAAVPRRVTILTGTAAAEALQQCSRPSPLKGTGRFKPTAAQIAMLDRAATIAPRRGRGTGLRTVAQVRRKYAVEVVGIVRGRERTVYGNYYPLSLQEGQKTASPHATVVCDGGRTFFGIEIDATTGRTLSMEFNGRAG